MKKIFYLFVFAFFSALSFQGNCQYNMVPNPSFELYNTCPTSLSSLNHATFWSSPMNTTPDLQHACSNSISWAVGVPQNVHGFQNARSGMGYGGIISFGINGFGNPNDAREYLQSPLISNLLPGKTYFVRFFVSPGDSCNYVTNDIAAFFSTYEIDTIFSPAIPLPFQPQIQNLSTNNITDPNSWTEVSGIFIANGGESHIIIGNFKDGLNSNYTNTNWNNNPNFSMAVQFVDDILVTPLDSLTSINEINSNEELSLSTLNNNEFEITSKYHPINSFEVVNCLGQIIDKKVNVNDNSLQLNMEEFANGIYFVRVQLQNEKIQVFKIFRQ